MTAALAERLYRQLHPPLRAMLARAYGADLADEAASVAWSRLLGKPDPWVRETEVGRWLWVVARNHVRRLHARRREIPDGGACSALLPAAGGLDDLVDGIDLRIALSGLSTRQRDAILGRVAGLTYREVGDLRGRTLRQVDRHTTEGRAALREALA